MSRASLWRGRTLAFLGIILLSLNLRIVVAATSPIYDEIGAEIELTPFSISLLGALPPLVFALSGVIAPALARRIGQARTVVIALVMIAAGHLVRAVSGDGILLVLGTALALVAMGLGNVLMPPLVKRYFPDRIGLMTGLFSAGLALSTTLPPLAAVPVAESAGWRLSLGVWVALAILTLLPWLAVAFRTRVSADTGPISTAAVSGKTIPARQLWRSPLAVGLALSQVVSATIAYSMFAWLPEIALAHGLDHAQAGTLLAVFAAIGLPFALLMPPLAAARPAWQGALIASGGACVVVGAVGLMFPSSTMIWLWASVLGAGPLIFPLIQALVADRTRSEGAAVSLSGFVNGVGYIGAATGPVVLRALHAVSGGWLLPLLFLALVGLLPLLLIGVFRGRRMLEDTLPQAP